MDFCGVTLCIEVLNYHVTMHELLISTNLFGLDIQLTDCKSSTCEHNYYVYVSYDFICCAQQQNMCSLKQLQLAIILFFFLFFLFLIFLYI